MIEQQYCEAGALRFTHIAVPGRTEVQRRLAKGRDVVIDAVPQQQPHGFEMAFMARLITSYAANGLYQVPMPLRLTPRPVEALMSQLNNFGAPTVRCRLK